MSSWLGFTKDLSISGFHPRLRKHMDEMKSSKFPSKKTCIRPYQLLYLRFTCHGLTRRDDVNEILMLLARVTFSYMDSLTRTARAWSESSPFHSTLTQRLKDPSVAWTTCTITVQLERHFRKHILPLVEKSENY